LAERARKLGLTEAADKLLNGQRVDILRLINREKEGLILTMKYYFYNYIY